MALGTTTSPNRNLDRLKKAKDSAERLGFCKPVIIDYGPGGVVDFLIDWFPKEEKHYWNEAEKLQRGIVKLAESVLRKTNLFNLKTPELEEIVCVMQGLSPQRIYVVDKEKKVVDAVNRFANELRLFVPIYSQVLDVEESPFERTGDIVIAYNIVERTRNPATTLKHIAGTTNIGGLLSTTVTTAPEGFKEIERGLYRRVN